jgi:hypothetical protein
VFKEQFMLCFIRMFRNNNPPAMPDSSPDESSFSCKGKKKGKAIPVTGREGP